MSRTRKVSDCCSIYDCLHATPNYSKDGIPMVRVTEIKNCFLDCSDSLKVDENTYKKYTQKHIPQKGDILLARVGAFLGQFALVVGDQKFCIGQNTTLLSPAKHSEYIFYYLISPHAQKKLKGYSSGSAYKSVGVSTISDFSVQFPENDYETESIGNLLYSIDMFIQKNRNIGNLIEDMLKLLYDHWFVQFDFPDANGKPYKSSGGKMVWNEELKREIPEGWEIKTIRDLAIPGKDKAYTSEKNICTIDLSMMISGKMMISRLNDSNKFSTNLFEMKKGDILFGSIRPYLRKAGLAPCDGAVAGTIHCFRPKKESDYNFVAITICNDRMFDYATSASQGTKMPVVTLNSIMDYKVPYNPDVCEQFGRVNIKDLLASCVMQNQQLSSLRDFLLPMLMNGQVKVKEQTA